MRKKRITYNLVFDSAQPSEDEIFKIIKALHPSYYQKHEFSESRNKPIKFSIKKYTNLYICKKITFKNKNKNKLIPVVLNCKLKIQGN